MHPHLNALLAEQRRLSCPCGARTARPGTLCRKCRHTALWLRHTREAKTPRALPAAWPPTRASARPHFSPW